MNGFGLSLVQKETVADFKARAEVHAERMRQISAQRNEELRKLAAYDDLVAALKQMDVFFGSMAGACEDEAEAAIKQCRAALRKAGVE